MISNFVCQSLVAIKESREMSNLALSIEKVNQDKHLIRNKKYGIGKAKKYHRIEDG